MQLQHRIAGAVLTTALLVVAASASAAPPPNIAGCELVPVADPQHVFLETPLGTIEIETYSNVAPLTVANFLGYIDRGDYQDTLVHRIVPGFVIQMGGYRYSDAIYSSIDRQPSVLNEPCISNVAGTLAMAKVGGNPNSATSEWFINLVDNSGGSAALDTQNGGFTVFGRVLDDGLSIANDIAALTDTVPGDAIPPYYSGVDGALWDLFGATPITQPLFVDDAAYGCFDVDQSGILLVENPTGSGQANWEPDPDLGLLFTLVSYACTGAGGGGAGPDPLPCQDPAGRRMLELDPTPPGSFIVDGNAEFGFAEQTLSCDALDESLASYDARIADISSQLDATFVKTSYSVPEAGTGVSALAALLSLAALRRRSRPAHPGEPGR